MNKRFIRSVKRQAGLNTHTHTHTHTRYSVYLYY